ncbi:Sec-independent protein translocase protein TatB [Microvirga sp. GCM10011540]|uniref:Sec-independent protein translocase protein TatB n=1 Tax=Microvirga sp. GCM10011540 TaxID=3317338 RepID=UPI003616ECDE
MLDMSWGEVMVIGAVALIIIGPKDLPRALRTVGNITGKVRRMAAEFQGQFQEAIREAELDDVKKQLQGVNDSVSSLNNTNFNPIQSIRDELKGAVEAPVKPQDPAIPAEPVRDVAMGREEVDPPPAADIAVPLPPPPMDDPAEAIAESLKREAEAERQKAAAAAPSQEKSDAKAG